MKLRRSKQIIVAGFINKYNLQIILASLHAGPKTYDNKLPLLIFKQWWRICASIFLTINIK